MLCSVSVWRFQEDMGGLTAVMLDQHRLFIGLVGIVVVEVHEVMESFDTYSCQSKISVLLLYTDNVGSDRLIR